MNLSSQITDQEPDAIISDVIQAVILMRSFPSDYDTTIEILTNKEKFPKIGEVFQAAKTTETKLAEPEIPTELEIANSTTTPSEKRAKVCWVCKGNHVKPKCPQWLQTKEGINFKNSGLKWHQWKDLEKKTTDFANAAVLNNHPCHCKQVQSLDSDSECERSIYFSAATSTNVKYNWGLDTMCSCHLTPYKHLFIGKIIPARVPIEVANGSTIYSEGKGDVRIY